MTNKYPSSTVRNLLQSDLISPQTKEVLNNRLKELDEKYEPAFFDSNTFILLRTVSDRLIPQTGNEKYIDLAASIDRRLTEGKSDGWRYAFMPSDGECYKLGLDLIDKTSIMTYRKTFIELGQAEQDNVLSDVQQGTVTCDARESFSSHHFFRELLAELTEAYYSHPLAQEEIGYAGMADMHGWTAITLDHREAHEPPEKR